VKKSPNIAQADAGKLCGASRLDEGPFRKGLDEGRFRNFVVVSECCK